MSSKLFQDLNPDSVFTNMYSKLWSSRGNWPKNLFLPNPFSNSIEVSKKVHINSNDNKKNVKPITACPHTSRKHYAKNMCNNCYHRLGRDKTAWTCEHQDRKHYAKGKCQFCYLKQYNQLRNSNMKEDDILE